MNPRQVVLTILSGAGVFGFSLALLGLVNVMLRLVLQARLLDRDLVLAGRWGVAAAIRRLWRADAAHGTTDLTAVSTTATVVLVFAGFSGGLVATVVLRSLPLHRSWPAGAGAVVGVLAYAVLLWRGVAAVTRPRLVVHGRLVNRPARAAATLAAFLHRVWVGTVNVAWALSAVFLLIRVVAMLGGRPQGDVLGVVGVTFVAAFATMPAVLAATGMVDEFWIGVVTQQAIAQVLSPERTRRPRRPTARAYGSPHRVPDRYAADRAALGRIAVLLTRSADRIDRGVPAPARPQPVATLLRGAVDVLTGHLRDLRSVTGPPTPRIASLLGTVAAVLVGPWRGATYDELNRQVDAFDPDGRPAARLPGLGERSVTRYARRLADAVDTGHRFAVAVLGLASLAFLVYLVAVGHRGVAELLHP